MSTVINRHIAIMSAHRNLSSNLHRLAAAIATGSLLVVEHNGAYDLKVLEDKLLETKLTETKMSEIKMPEDSLLDLVEYRDLKSEREPWRRGRPLR